MPGRVISGRQEPTPGSKRYIAMTLIKPFVQAHHHPTGQMQRDIAASLGMSINRVQNALIDLDLFDADFHRAIPAPKNGFKVTPGWNTQAEQGEGNQLRHAATRLERTALRMEKNARVEGNPAKAMMMRMAARDARSEALNLREVAVALDT